MSQFSLLDHQAVAALRVLAVDQVEAARSGHPGMPLGAAPMAYVLWSRFLCHDPEHPHWPGRDRFILSAGHGSALLYALLHLFGYDLPLEELKRFRQWGSRTPGHPEYGHTPGVEITTGPLGQGFAAAVGMALGERHMGHRFNRPGTPIFDNRTFVIASDGDLQEGISHEAAALAGHWRLGRLVVLWDDNGITIDGPASLAWSEDVPGRFSAYGWRVVDAADGNDLDTMSAALTDALAQDTAPVLVRVSTTIGFGSPGKAGTSSAHGAPLGPAEAAATRRALGWTQDAPFVVPTEIREHCRRQTDAGRRARLAWEANWQTYQESFPKEALDLQRRWRRELPQGWRESLPNFDGVTTLATREASGMTINALAPVVTELLGGAADLAGSTNTVLQGEHAVAPGQFGGRVIHFGIREHAMAAVANGLSLYGGLRPFVGTFLIFSDYLRPALRLSALMRQPVVYVFTHDSLGVGEDGPTHQPIEQLVSLRLIPGTVVLRPADARETAAAWEVALTRTDGPTVLVLSRQKLPVLPAVAPHGVARGATIRAEASQGAPEVILLATGSEVSLALDARTVLEAAGIPTRVVSAPSLELLSQQDEDYHREVLGPAHVLRVAVEAGRGQGWHRWVGDGELVVLRDFGASAPGEEILSRRGFAPGTLAARVKSLLLGRRWAEPAVDIPHELRQAMAHHKKRLLRETAPTRLFNRDDTLFGLQHRDSVARRLGWLDLPSRSRALLPDLERLVAELSADGLTTMVLLGMGGSSLGPEVLRQVGGAPSGRELVVLDTTDPHRTGVILDRLDPASTVVLAVSKSGTTTETVALVEVFWHHLGAVLGDETGRHFLALTEPGTALELQARERGFRSVLPHPVDVGGRFSLLSAVGLLPALWLGQDAEALLRGGERALQPCSGHHTSLALASALAAAAKDGWAVLAWAASSALQHVAAWAEQLVAESTGKLGRGILPVTLPEPPDHGHLWPGTVVFSPRYRWEDTAALDIALDAAVQAGHPVIRVALPEPSLGELCVTLELATAFAGVLLGVNPFDEPDVVRAKDQARVALSGPATKPLPCTADPVGLIRRHLADAGPGDGAVVLAYIPETTANADALRRLAAQLSTETGLPVTAAFGPRYLHSTGQLHKGGPPRLRIILLTAQPQEDLPIPGQPHTLGRLRQAQALGDLAALQEAGRPVVHLVVGPHLMDLLDTLAGTR